MYPYPAYTQAGSELEILGDRKTGMDIKPEDTFSGYTIFNDWSAAISRYRK
jgi:hypothetical protein